MDNNFNPYGFTFPSPFSAEDNQSGSDNTVPEKQDSSCDGSVTINKNGHYIHCLTIIGQIEGHYLLPSGTKATKYEHVIPQLVAIEESNDIDGLIVILNTVGGDIEAGLALAELIAGMKKPVVSLVLGGGHSIGVPLAVSAKRSFIVPSATMTIHPVRMNGLVLAVSQSFDYLEKMQNRIIKFITDHSEVDERFFRKIMHRTDSLVNDIGSILEGEEAVRCGLIDEVGGLDKALGFLKSIKNR